MDSTARARDAGPADVPWALLRKYDTPGPRYTSYPTAVEFTEEFSERTYRDRLAEANRRSGEPLSLYVHLPFCERRCSYCGCNVVITRKRSVIADYVRYLGREIDLVASCLPDRRTVSQLHWGGGTPTYLTEAEIVALDRKVREHFTIAPTAEVAIEVDPRVTDRAQLRLLRTLGFNRVSLGVQDFTPEVQAAVERDQTEAETRGAFEDCRELGFDSINLDLIYGLPLQTPRSFERNLAAVVDLRPDRVAVYSYAYVPWLKAHQKRMDAATLPPPDVKLQLFGIARRELVAAGYVPIGMDHFALPDDELVRAMAAQRLQRNFMGYTVSMGSDSIGFGVTAIGDVRNSLAQNAKKLSTYYASIDEGELPIERGRLLDRDDEIRREVIMALMCNFVVDARAVGKRYGIDFDLYFADELAELRAEGGAVHDGLVAIHPDRIEVVGHGRRFVRNVCMVFDRYRRKIRAAGPVFSQTV